MPVADWFLSGLERANPATCIDARHGAGLAWSAGNQVMPLVHGATYFRVLLDELSALGDGDMVLFTDWRGDPDQALDDTGAHVSHALCRAAERGAIVRGLVWRSHADRLSFSAQQNRRLEKDINAAGGQCVLDQRVRPGGSHHQKFVVVRHRDRPDDDVAFVGGIDLCHSRRDDSAHAGDPQKQPMASVYGATPPWHDVQLEIRGPAVGDVEAVFRERWSDPAPFARNPVDRISERLRRDPRKADPLPPQGDDPKPRGSCQVQLLRTYANRHPGYPFAPDGERSVAHGYDKVVDRARALIYIEDQYLWSHEIVRCFAKALADSPELRMIAVIPRYPDQDGRFSMPPNLVGRQQAIDDLNAAAPGRVAVYGVENPAGTPVYVHAKVCVVDDVWASVGSDNVNRRSWTHDSELTCAVFDDGRDMREPAAVDGCGDGARTFARGLRLELAREHLDRADGNDADLLDPISAFDAFRASGARLQGWYDDGCRGPRPPGRLRPYSMSRLSRRTLAWATPLYRIVYDPDGRPLGERYRHRF